MSEDQQPSFESTKKADKWPLYAIVTLGGAGSLRPAPGTWGSLAATLFLWLLRSVSSSSAWLPELIGGIVLCGIGTVASGKWIADYFGDGDPGACVIDEGAGICLTLICLPMDRPWLSFALAFAAFRLFDVLKPPPARQLEKLPLGWGVLTDDLAAAVYANLLCQFVLRYLVR